MRCGGENSLHDKKFDKSIFDIKFHAKNKSIVTAGADHSCKIFAFD